MNEVQRQSSRTARLVGALFLGAFLTYGVGSILTSTATAAPDYLSEVSSNPLFPVGAVLMLLNSAVVTGIGVLMFPVLVRHSRAVAAGYLATRIFEAVLLAVGVVSLLSLTGIAREADAGALDAGYYGTLAALAVNGGFLSYQVAMAGLGLGSVFLCSLLLRKRLVPRFLAVWGLAGYAVFAAGAVLELLGFAGLGVVFTVPGGLFELFFGIWLLAGKSPLTTAAAVPTERVAVS
jgi:hypothetical protein